MEKVAINAGAWNERKEKGKQNANANTEGKNSLIVTITTWIAVQYRV